MVTSSEDNLPLPGVNVVVPGTTIGTITNIEGTYSITVPKETEFLEFSFVGMEPKQVSVLELSMLDVQLSPESYEMKEVVVTALGIRRESKSLGFSVTRVDNEDITRNKDRSMLNALQGKVAGVNISSASGAPGSSSRISLRGVSSLTGSNEPLFIIDGIPVNNQQSGSTSINNGTDFGNKINDLNPEDIESISIIKGASGAALYGSRAANGVILITTKKGNTTEERKTKVDFSSSVTFEEPLRLIDYQNRYGQGAYGEFISLENWSWGPKFDDVLRYWGYEVDNSLRVKAYEALPENVEEFFETGINYTNQLSVAGGSSKYNYFLSYSNVTWDGIFPTDVDNYKRHTLTINNNFEVTDRFTVAISLKYIHKQNSFVTTGQGENSVYNQVMQTPRDISLLELEDIDSKWNNLDNYYSPYTVNPWYIIKNNSNKNIEDRLVGNFDFNYAITDHFSALLRIGGDVSNEHLKEIQEIIDPSGNNEFSAAVDQGYLSKSSVTRNQLNADFILTYKRDIGKIGINTLIGYNINQRSADYMVMDNYSKSIKGFDNFSGTNESSIVAEGYSLRRLIGVYGNLELSYASTFFLTGTYRNDWSSTLPLKNNSFSYPGISGAVIVSELIEPLKSVVPYFKLRGGITRVGNDASPYNVYSVFSQGYHSDGYGFIRYPFSGINSYEVGNRIGNDQLKPELTTEYEIGSDIRLLNNRIGVDVALYKKITTNLIWPVPVASSSGYGYITKNLGKISNKGIEVLLNVTPVKRNNLQWDITFNFARNRNLLESLDGAIDKVVGNGIGVDGGQQINFIGISGKPLWQFEARTALRDEQGRIVVDNQGIPRAADSLVIYGNSNYDFTGGAYTTFRYKNIVITAAIDVKYGGIMYSKTKDISIWAGTVPLTLYNDREPFIVPNSVYEIGEDENGDPVYVENNIPLDRYRIVDYWGNGGSEIDGSTFIDKSYMKLREVTISYNLPRKIYARLPIQRIRIDLIGKNLWLWTPSDQIYIDPEITTFGNDTYADFGEYGAQPSVRSINVGLSMQF